MQSDAESQDLKLLAPPQMYNMDLNGGHIGGQPAFPGYNAYGGNKIVLEQVDPSQFEDDSDEDEYGKTRHGKKTKGRVKIKMEFIENKLRRYTTFSKRKTGIMKKAYELSTLTGTQVMLLVASETGHVYTFATRKLQPMITSESGKALIQTCLNSPDPPPLAPGQQSSVEQRMNPGGFEETELTYAVDEENAKLLGMETGNGSLQKPIQYTLTSAHSTDPQTVSHHQSQQQQPAPPQSIQPAASGQTYQLSHPAQPPTTVTTLVQQPTVASPQPPQLSKPAVTPGSISVQLPSLPPGFILQPGTQFTIPVQNGGQPQPQTVTTTSAQQQTVFRLPGGQQFFSSAPLPQQSVTTNTSSATTVNVIPAAAPPTSALTPSVFMYQTPQGIVYAPATGSMQDNAIFNFQQPATALSVPAPETPGGGGQQQQQQIITIPVPVSMSASPQMLQLTTSDTGGQLQDISQSLGQQPLSQPTPAKKHRK